MNIRHKDLIIEKDNAFANCKLGREKYANVLTSIVSSYADGFVLAINNEWGAGKTTFVKMWQQKLEDEKFKTLYFNAWENDFDANPLVALLAELKSVSDIAGESQFRLLVKQSTVIAKSIIPNIIKTVAERYIDTKALTELIEKTAEGASEILLSEVDEFAKKKQGLKDFKKKLKDYVRVAAGNKPLVFIIDELDRCRPNYAVELLEQIKHFFSVPGIVFVLSIDKLQLGNAVKGFYGNDSINSDEYLRRFIDLEYKLPAPDREAFCKYLYSYYDFAAFFEAEIRKQSSEVREDGNLFLDSAIHLLNANEFSLRQCEKIFAQARLGLKTFISNHYVHPRAFFIICLIRFKFPEFFDEIKNKMLSRPIFLSKLRSIFPANILEVDERKYLMMEAEMLVLYNHSYFENRHWDWENRKLILNDTHEARGANPIIEEQVCVNSTITGKQTGIFLEAVKIMQQHFFRTNNIGTDLLVRKVELFEQVQSGA